MDTSGLAEMEPIGMKASENGINAGESGIKAMGIFSNGTSGPGQVCRHRTYCRGEWFLTQN
jgi:hypothetical protein